MADWPSDKELEEIYRRGSEFHDFQYSPEAWADMEDMLDKSWRKRFLFILLLSVGVLVTSWMTINFFFSQGQITDSNLLTTEIAHVTTELSQTDTNIESASASSNNTQSALESTSQLTNQNIITTESSASKVNEKLEKTQNLDMPSHLNTTTSEIKASIKSSNKIVGSPNINYQSNNNPIGLAKSKSSLDSDGDINSAIALSNVDAKSNANTVQHSSTTTKLEDDNLITQGVTLLQLLQINPLIIKNPNWPVAPHLAETNENKVSLDRFSISAVLNTESSWTPNGKFSTIDVGLGLTASYFLNRKWAVTAGASYINDVYTAEKGDYKASRDFWKANGAPEYTTANSSMIEISTGATYYFAGIDNGGFSTSVNLLSNFMIKEEYNYHFTEESNNFSSSWSMANQTWLNGLSLAANYKFNLSEKIIFESGPYIKVPLSGIGHGDVKLSAFGLRFAIGIR